MGDGNCPICNMTAQVRTINDGQGNPLDDITCHRCGRYFINHFDKEHVIRALGLDEIGMSNYRYLDVDGSKPISETALYAEVAKKAADGKGTNVPRSIISHVLRKNVGTRPPELRIEQLVNILKINSALTPAEQANNVIAFLGRRLSNPGDLFLMPSVQGNIYGLLGVRVGDAEWNDLEFMLKELISQQMLRRIDNPFRVSLTLAGWQKYEELARSVNDSRKAFVAMEFPDQSRPENYFFQTRLLDEFRVPAARKTGYALGNALRSDPKAGNLHARLEVEIRTARFVVAEMSHNNNGAYWEAGFARGLGKPVIYMFNKEIAKADRPHFDVGSDLYVSWTEKEPEKAAEARAV
jgi:hypothetical protein